MTNASLEVGQKYVALVKQAKFEACLQELFSKDAVSVEAWSPPGVERVTSGLTAIRAKGEAWARDHEVHSVEVVGPYPLEQRFAVLFRFEVTSKSAQRKLSMEEIGLFTVEGGKIVREEFFYAAG